MAASPKKPRREDFALVFRQKNAMFFRIAYSYLHNEDEAYDLVQTAFERAMEHAESYSGDASLASWITAILINAAKNHLRDRKKFVSDEAAEILHEAAPTMGEPPRSPFFAFSDAENMGALAHAYNRLSGRQREVLRLRLDADLSFNEVAKALDISAVDARVTYHSAVQKLKTLVSGTQPMEAAEEELQ
jgi:RNA polymerase sigma-70 factor, ECF subfamily